MINKISEHKLTLEDGNYNALWSGYNLDILSNEDNSKLVTISTIDGVRGFNCNVKIEIIKGYVYQK